MKNEKLQNARKERGFTQQQLATRVGVAKVTLRKWESGSLSPSVEIRNLLCEVLEKTAAQLGLDDTDIPKEGHLASLSPKSADQNRLSMLKRVRSIWIDGVLKQSLYKAVLIALGLETQPDALMNPWRMAVQETSLSPRPLPLGTSIAQVFDDSSGEVLILGEPGSGKTTLLLELTRILLDRAEQDESHPIPVVFNLSSWAVKQQPLAEWLVEELHSKYRVPYLIGQEWVESNQILVLLDGLDEVAEAVRTDCVKAINVSKQVRSSLPLVVCCRKEEYFAQTTRVMLQQAIVILPLTRKQVDRYLARAGKALADVSLALSHDAELQEMVKSPLLLNILVLTNLGEGKAPLDKMTGSVETRRELMFSIYAQRMLTRRGRNKYYTQEQTFHWLGYLARSLKQQDQTEFYLERMQPDICLPDQVRSRFHRTIVQLVFCIEAFVLSTTLAWIRGGKTTPTFGGVGGGLLGMLGSGPGERVLEWMSPGLGLSGLSGGGLISFVFAIVAVLVGIMIDRSSLSGKQIHVRQALFKGIRNGLMCAGLVGLFCLLFFGLRGGLLLGLTYASSFGILTGLIVGTLSGVTTGLRERKPVKRRYLQGILPGLSALIGFWSIDGMLRLYDGFVYGFVVAVFFYVAYSFGQANERIRISPEIQPAEVVAWSWSGIWRNLPRDITRGLLIGLVTAISVTIFFGLVSGIARGPSYGIALGFVFGPIIGVSVGIAGTLSGILNSGLKSDMLQKKDIVRPNEGIHRSARHALLAAAIFGPIGGIICGIACGISFGLIARLAGWPILASGFAIVFGILFSFYFLMIRGGIACLSHAYLRYSLWRRGVVPLHYVHFLDYAAERIILRNIGGGYIFVHRLILEYFADKFSKEEERKEQTNGSKSR